LSKSASPNYIIKIISFYLLGVLNACTNKSLFILNLVLLTLLGVFGLNFEGITNNNIMSMKTSLNPSQIISPKPITQFEDLEFTEHQVQNLKYFSSSKDSLFFLANI
jgi:hypothetical protein